MERRSLLVSDVDGTLLGDDAATLAFAEWHAQWRHQVCLVYASGRFVESVAQSVRETALPEPTAIIGGVGTQIQLGLKGPLLADFTNCFADWCPDRVRQQLDERPELELQPAPLQSSYKVSYYGWCLSGEYLNSLKHDLHSAGVDATVVYSSERDLDILPAAASKGAAARYLARHWDFRSTDVIVCGDSGNDASLFEGEFRGIVVANAQPELKRLSGPAIYHSPLKYAAGVLDGLRHWHGGLRKETAVGRPG